VGTVTREEFVEEIQSRGGGFDQALVIEAVDGVAAEVGTDEFEITSLSAAPESAVVTMEVRDPRNPDQLDDYTFRNGDLESSEPVRLSATDDLEADAFPIGDIELDRLNAMVDAALEGYDTEGGYVTSLSFGQQPSPDNPEQSIAVVTISLESPRSSATATFTGDGEPISLDQS
jgi:hypothetical protein